MANDGFGALAVALHGRAPTSWSDSWLAHEATRRNIAANGLDPASVAFLPSTEDPSGPFDLLLVKVPRTLAHLRDQLLRLRHHLAPGAVVIGAGMTKQVHTSTIEAFAEAIGPTRTTLARRKARLLLAEVDPGLAAPATPYPTTFAHDVPGHGRIEVVNHANVFGREKLDLGARVLLDHLPTPAGERDVVDLGCGNGVLGTVAALADPSRRLVFADESHGAVASALATHAGAVPGGHAEGHVGHLLAGRPDDSADLVLCNPPFHAQGARVDHVAPAMFADAVRVLRPGGRLVVVGNRHLGHHRLLRRHGRVTQLGGDHRFVVLELRPSGGSG